VIFEALSLGAEFCDIFIDKQTIENITMNSSKVKDIRSGVDFGIGIRLIYGDQALYGYTNSTDKEELVNLTRILAEQNKKKVEMKGPIAFKTKAFKEIAALGNKEVSLKEKINHLHSLNKKVRANSELISQVSLTLTLKKQEIEIFDSEGLHVLD